MTYKEAALKLCSGYLDMPSGCDGCPLATDEYDDDGNMICALNTVPEPSTINAVPVVRCRDCKHSYESISGRCCTMGPCVDCIVPEDFFCRYGVRREADHD